ncbi:MAG: universal stress protein [Actinomycetota bacterium]
MTDAPSTPAAPAPMQTVGIDGSDGALHALRWAVAHRDTLGPVQPVMVWRHPWWASMPTEVGRVAPLLEIDFAHAARATARSQIELLDGDCCHEPVIVHGATGPALVAVADRGSLLVVGTRGRSGVVGQLLGSTSRYCVQHAAQPVIVVPDTAPIEDRHHRVVVGIDGSPEADRALDWALDHTAATTSIHLIHVRPPLGATAGVPELARQQAEEQSQAMVDAAVARIGNRAGDQRKAEGHSCTGDPREILGTEGRRSDLLVIGGRGHGGLTHRFLGSTATALVEHPTTPTVVVR